MKLQGIEFAPAWNAAGARNFFGEGWPYHDYLGPLRPRFYGATFVAKTTTLEPRAGHMPLNGTRPKELVPKCIKVNFRKAAVLNAVGLSGPGFDALLADGRWQSRLEPFFLSFMAVDNQVIDRLDKARDFGAALDKARVRFKVPFGLEVNFSCPNVGLVHSDFVHDTCRMLETLRRQLPGVPLVPKFNALFPVDAARQVAQHYACDAVCVSNTIPWGAAPDRIDWKGLFGEVSPLAKWGGGGLSGAPIAPLVRSWFYRACIQKDDQGKTVLNPFPVPLIGGGGVVNSDHALELLATGCQAVEVGSVAIVRPWRVAGIIKTINKHQGYPE